MDDKYLRIHLMINIHFLGRHSLMARPQDSVSLFWRKSDYPQFLKSKRHFSICIICKKDSPGITKGHQERFLWVSLGSLGFPHLNIIDFTNHRPKLAAFSLKTFRLFFNIYQTYKYIIRH